MTAFQVDDMTCGHCISAITKAVKGVDPSASVSIDMATHRVDIGSTQADAAKLSAAIKEAGLTGKVFLITSGAGEQSSACDQVKAGVYDVYMSYDVSTQAKEMASSIKWLLQNKGKVSGAKGTIYSRIIPITKANVATEGLCWKLGKS